ncbi:MAG: hypothetical protein LBC61_00705 [Candidatus Peribacteria bacterium]|nr:hypothetical protein [Candidatus Peribacteria bacterium]
MDNKEDIVYNRFTTGLANKLKSEILQYSKDEVYEILSKTNPDIQNTST